MSLLVLELPAAATNRMPASPARLMAAAMVALNPPPPHELLIATMLAPWRVFASTR